MPVATEVKGVSPVNMDLVKPVVNDMNDQLSNQMDLEEDSSSEDSMATSSECSSTSNSPSPSPKHIVDRETVIVFDWDDTLLASSFLCSKGYKLDFNGEFPPELQQQLHELEDSVITVVESAMQYGTVHIITNAETGWVELSAAKFIPRVVPLLSKVTVLSARSTFETAHPDSPFQWKYNAFQYRLQSLFNWNGPKTVISFGDSHVEREACRAVTKNQDNCLTKSVKFSDRPNMDQLQRQINLVANCLDYICGHEGDLDLMLTISAVDN